MSNSTLGRGTTPRTKPAAPTLQEAPAAQDLAGVDRLRGRVTAAVVLRSQLNLHGWAVRARFPLKRRPVQYVTDPDMFQACVVPGGGQVRFHADGLGTGVHVKAEEPRALPAQASSHWTRAGVRLIGQAAGRTHRKAPR